MHPEWSGTLGPHSFQPGISEMYKLPMVGHQTALMFKTDL